MGFAISRGALPDSLYWDTEEPYHYVRLQPGDKGLDIVLVGGEDHKSGEADDSTRVSSASSNGRAAKCRC